MKPPSAPWLDYDRLRAASAIDLEDAADRRYVVEWVARTMGVSAEVIGRRGKYDGLWRDF